MSSAPRPADDERGSRSVASRVLSVLDAFAGERRRLTLSDISRRTGMPLATTHRLVGELLSWGALERSRNGRYQIGLHLWAVAASAPRWLGLREVAAPFLEDLHEMTGQQQVRLAVLDGARTVPVERIPTRDADIPRCPAHTTADGLVLLAYTTAVVQERYLARHERATGLRRVLAEVRRAGYAVTDQTPDSTVAAPVRDATGEVMAAVSVVVRAGRPRALAPVVVHTGRTISGALLRRREGR
jgi:DNA-binding IclR family transcriptional regulator